MSACLYFEKPIVVLFVFKKKHSFQCAAFTYSIYVAVRLSPWYFPCFARGPGFNPQRRHFFFFLFSRFSLITSQSACLYIIVSFEVLLIAENNYPHIGLLVVLFQLSSADQYILMPSISDMPLLYSISSLKSMTDMRGSSNFRLSGGGGGGGQEKRLCQLFGPQTYLQWVHRPQHVNSGINCQYQRKLYFLVPKGVQHFPGVGVELNCLFPIELVIFKVSSGHLPPPPPNLLSGSVHD